MAARRLVLRRWTVVGLTLVLLALMAPDTVRGEGNLLIVTAEAYADSAPLNEFVAAKTARGLNVVIYTAVPGTSRDSIKAHIETLWDSPDAPDYILLIGDASNYTATSTALPYWMGGGSKQAPTDLTYGCMDGGDDWHPEIAIGRFPITSVAGLQAMVDKTLYVEAGDFPDPDYIKRGAFVANPDTYGMAEPTHDWVIENLFEPNDYEGIRIYVSDGAVPQDVTDAVNGGCLLVVYYGHSSSTYWRSPHYGQSEVRALSNAGLYGVVTSHSCNAGNFTLNECLAETWVEEAGKGAAAAIFTSDYIYWDSQEEWLRSTILEHSWFRSFFEDDIWEVGPAWHAALYRFEADYDGSVDVERNFFEEYNLLGDPSLLLPHGSNPMFVSPQYELVSQGPVGGPFVPDGIAYELRNKADYAIDYEVSHGSAVWVTLSGDLSGTLDPDGTASVTVQINSNAESLSFGGYSDTVQFVNLTDHIGDVTRGVTLYVGVPELQYEWTLDSDPGWSTQGLWAFGQPTGGGGQYGGPDPTSGYSGPSVYGYNLDGDYEDNMPERHLTTDAIDCTYLTRTSLRFWRWLGVEQPAYDHAHLRVSVDGSAWTTVWENDAEITDSSWQHQEFDISDVADGQSTVYLRWTMGTSDGGWRYCGWNIDDFEFWGVRAIPGDLNGDGCVDQPDLGVLLADWGCSGGSCPGDIDADGDTDQADLGILLAHWGDGCG